MANADDLRADILAQSALEAEHQKKTVRSRASEILKVNTLEDLLRLFKMHDGVIGVMVMDREGKIVCSNLDDLTTAMYCGISKQILDTMCPTIEVPSNPSTHVETIRINSEKQEVVIAPVSGEDVVFIIVQNPPDNPSVASAIKSKMNKAKEKRLDRGTKSNFQLH